MGRRKNDEVDGQQELIDVKPENAKIILRCARAYLKSKQECADAAEIAKEKKIRLRDAVKEAKLQPLDGGVIRVRVGNEIVTVTPREESVTVKPIGAGDGEEDEASEE